MKFFNCNLLNEILEMKSFKWNSLDESFLNEFISMESFKWDLLNEVC